ncbi:hypothetical protein BH23VER1_BH23VER1_24020 [soil metagenome]
MIYCDTSFLVSLYIEDSHSKNAQQRLTKVREPLVWTPWHNLELCTALAAKVGRGESTPREVEGVRHQLERHRSPWGFFREPPVRWPEALNLAAELGHQHGAAIRSRSLDVVHVAIALQIGTTRFWSFDTRQNTLAAALALDVSEVG